MVRRYSQNQNESLEENDLSSIDGVVSASGSPLKKGEQTKAILTLGKEVSQLQKDLKVAVEETRKQVGAKSGEIIEQAKTEARGVAQELTAKTLETIGIFAALLAFVSFEAQIFKGPLSALSIVGASSIFFSALFIFVLLLDVSFSKDDDGSAHKIWRIVLFGFAFACLIGGVLFAIVGYEKDKTFAPAWATQIKGELQSDYTSQIDTVRQTGNSNELLQFKNCIAIKGLYACLGD